MGGGRLQISSGLKNRWKLLLATMLLLLMVNNSIQKRLVREPVPYSSYKSLLTVKVGNFSDTYTESSIEKYIMENLEELGYETKEGKYAEGCTIWNDRTEQSRVLRQWENDLNKYQTQLQKFQSPYKDMRRVLHEPNVCQHLQVDSSLSLKEMFHGQLSTSGRGLVEPLFPPLRSPSLCDKGHTGIMSLDFLIHDFVAICQDLKPSSRIVFFDLGASLKFHAGGDNMASPALYIPEIFRKFGMPFDHIYAFEITPTEPKIMYESIPDDLKTAYHWYNVGISADSVSMNNPWNIIRQNFNEDDLVVVKLDIDTPSVELPLAAQLLNDPELHKLVDHFYFEHHVHLSEIRTSWGSGSKR